MEAIKSKINKVIPSIFKASQNEQSIQTIKQSSYKFDSFVIDDIEFFFSSLDSKKEKEEMKKKLAKLYSDQYIQKFGFQRLSLQIVGKKFFLNVKTTNQTKYNHDKTRSNIKYFRIVEQIYNSPEKMKHFWSIDFSRLKVLNLSKHNLHSIEGITFMNIPNLVCLQLHTNNISKIDSLANVSLPKLKIITLYNNRISFGEKLNRGHFPKLRHFEFDNQRYIQSSMIQDINFIFKMQDVGATSKMYINDSRRIISKKKRLILENFRFGNIQLKLSQTYEIRRTLREIEDYENMVYD